MAEAVLRERLRERGIDARVSSAGLSFDDRPATPEAVEAAAALRVDIRQHRSRIMAIEMLERADLIIAMERLHAREAVVLGEGLFSRTYTLKELVRRGEAKGPRGGDERVAEWLERLGAGRRPMELMGRSDDDDVADPYGRGRPVYDACIGEIDDLVRRAVDLIWPRANEGAA
jgi:protein-tyrosine-phosphatase